MKSVGGYLFPAADQHCAPAVLEEYKSVDEALKFVKERNVCVQAGGNVGVWADYLAQKFGEVWTFEPDLENYLCLIRNVGSGVFPFWAALGHKPMSVSMNREPANAGAHSVNLNGGRVPVLTVDELELTDCNLMALDCEGYEPFVIEGARETIKRFKPVLMIEDKDISRHYGKREGWPEREIAGYKLAAKTRRDVILIPE